MNPLARLFDVKEYSGTVLFKIYDLPSKCYSYSTQKLSKWTWYVHTTTYIHICTLETTILTVWWSGPWNGKYSLFLFPVIKNILNFFVPFCVRYTSKFAKSADMSFKKDFPKKINMGFKRRGIWCWFRICWKVAKSFHKRSF